MNYENLLAAIMLQATKDYVYGTEDQQKQVLRDLRSDYMTALSDDQSAIIAEQLERNPQAIKERLRKLPKEE
ncbi:MAG: hypothetical protein UH850_14555 [Paludibacteraceae bacterium]|jgi:hypothetical protein|nr:hypothetical protein [Paludibacteraceae bacterium]